jgi:2-polyprenyl-3-methyl-5-hydroxy-6-metoxy-1,4-benzoquinol methylase
MLLNLIKKIPIDFGQGSVRYTTKGKKIALDLVGYCAENKYKSSDVNDKSVHIKCAALDVGCRSGHFTSLLEKRGYAVTSIDIEKGCEKCQIVDANKSLPYQDNHFDVIWCSEVIEHLENPYYTLNEFRRVLKPEGKAVLTTTNSRFWVFRILNLFGLSPKKVQNPEHKHFFSVKDIMNYNPDRNIIYGFFPYFLIKFRIRKFINLLSPTFIFVIKK